MFRNAKVFSYFHYMRMQESDFGPQIISNALSSLMGHTTMKDMEGKRLRDTHKTIDFKYHCHKWL
jgi:hypothetical protein